MKVLTKNPTILVTRPQPQADEFAGLLEADGFTPILSPLLETRVRQSGLLELKQATSQQTAKPDLILITSRAVFHSARESMALCARQWSSVPVITSGEKTAAAARAIGFQTVAASKGRGSAGMLHDIEHGLQPNARSRILYITGQPRTPLLEEALSGRADLHLIALYENWPADQLHPQAKSHMENASLDAVTLFSTHTAKVFADLVQTLSEPAQKTLRLTPVFCLSEKIAAVLRDSGFVSCHISASETQESVLDQLVDQLKNI